VDLEKSLKDVVLQKTGDNSMKEPCDHPGCHSHRTHPCESCGYQAGRSKNKSVVIGFMGLRRAYLNVGLDDALKRYLKEEGAKELAREETIQVFEFDDEFCVYDAWEK